MKAEIVRSKEFEPVKISITIESEEELRELWHRHNVAMNTLGESKYHLSHFKFSFESNLLFPLWEVADSLMKQHDIKP